MNILTDILSLFKRKKFRNHVKPDDVLVIGISEEPDIEGIASPVPYKDVKLVKYKDFLASAECENVNIPLGDPSAGVFKDTTTDPITGDCFDNFRKLKSLSLNLTITENGDFVEFDNLAEANTASNIGTGAGCFKQKTGEDFEFKSLTSVDGTVTITDNADTIDLSAGSSSFGVWSTVDALGELTYYSEYSAAVAAAVAGDTITLHANYTLSTGTGFDFKDQVNINLNGFTVTYSNTDTSSAFTDTVSGAVQLSMYNGNVVRTGQNNPGIESNTLALELINESSIACFGVKFINLDGWAIYVSASKIYGAEAFGDKGGIALANDYRLRDCYGYGTESAGISTTAGSRDGLVINCTGESPQSIGLNLEEAEVVNCVGYHKGSDNEAGAYLKNCNTVGIKGYSLTGSGVIIEGKSVNNCTGRTTTITAGTQPYIHGGVKLIDVLSAQDCHGFSNGDVNASGLVIVKQGGSNQKTKILNCSGSSSVLNTTGLVIIANNIKGTNDNILTLENCSAAGESLACELDSVNSGLSYKNLITILNSSFSTDQDAGICIEGTNTNQDLAYANCSFRTGDNSLGTPLVSITQTTTNTPDPQGNMYV